MAQQLVAETEYYRRQFDEGELASAELYGCIEALRTIRMQIHAIKERQRLQPAAAGGDLPCTNRKRQGTR